MKQMMSYDTSGYYLNGERGYLLSGEFHYFRVPRKDWRTRLELFKQAGGNTVATYVPWCIHEEAEGKISFSADEQTDLVAFLNTVREVGLGVIVRPGPYQYSELIGGGLPRWLLKGYPEILARRQNGDIILNDTVCYLHPVFLDKAREYYRAFAKVIKPFLNDPVVCIQLDNELMGIQVWRGSMDHHHALTELGNEQGRYAVFLRSKYGSVSALNQAYESSYSCFCEVVPNELTSVAGITDVRQNQDYLEFYCDSVRQYQDILASWCHQDGIDGVPLCHNIGTSGMVPLFCKGRAGVSFPCLYGVDHYYNLGVSANGANAPTPQYMFEKFIALEQLRLLGMPPTVLEMQGGNIVDTPPVLKEDLYAMYASHLAYGMKGVNYYVYTGGRNYKDTGATADIYDYNAMVHANGQKNATFEAMESFHSLVKGNPWLCGAERRSSVNIGFSWDTYFLSNGGMGSVALGQCMNERECREFLCMGVLYTLMTTQYAPSMAELSSEPDTTVPLVVPCCSAMSQKAQQSIVYFIKNGGRAVLLGVLPQTDERYYPCTVLRDFLGITETKRTKEWEQRDNPLIVPGFGKVYSMTVTESFSRIPPECQVLCTEQLNGNIAGFRGRYGKGEVICLSARWNIRGFDQSEFMEFILSSIGAKSVVSSKNRNVFTSLREDGAGHRMLFVMNLYSGSQSTDVSVYDPNGNIIFSDLLTLAPMEVKTINI